MKKQSKQRRKIAYKRLTILIALIFLLIMFAFFLAYSICNIIVCNNIDSENLKEYSGPFSVNKVHRARNTIYLFTLENGDVIRIVPELIEQNEKMPQFSQLRFTYSGPKIGLSSAYTGVEITDQSGEFIFLSPENARKEATSGVTVGILFSAIILALIILLGCFSLFKQQFHRKDKGTAPC